MLLEYGGAQSVCEAVSVSAVNIKVGPELEAGPKVYSPAFLVVRDRPDVDCLVAVWSNPYNSSWKPFRRLRSTRLTPIGGSEQTSWTTFAFLATLMLSRLGTAATASALCIPAYGLRSRKLKPNLHCFQETIPTRLCAIKRAPP